METVATPALYHNKTRCYEGAIDAWRMEILSGYQCRVNQKAIISFFHNAIDNLMKNVKLF